MKITIDNEEVLSNKDFTINEEMLNTSSVILNNVYPVEWEQDKDYVSRFYYPEDYSKCKIFNEINHPEEKSTASGTNFTLNNVDLDKQYYIENLKGQTSQNGTPTPSSPVPVETTTGRQEVRICGKNLFNKSIATTQVGYFNSSGNIENGGQSTVTTSYIPILPNTNLTISGFVVNRICYYDKNQNFLERSEVISTTPYTFNKNAYYIRIQGVTDVFNLNNFQIEKGSTASTYEAYNGTTKEINLGKNLFSGYTFSKTTNGITYTYNNDGTILVDGTSTGNAYSMLSSDATNFYRTLEAGTYTISGGITGVNVQLMDSSGTALANTTSKQTFTITEPKRYYLRLYISSGKTFDNQTIYIQLEKGSGTSYSPYKTPIELCKIGTYQDYIFKNVPYNPNYDSNLQEGWYIHKEIGKVVLNGSENWVSAGNNTYAYDNEITNYLYVNQITIICDYYNAIANGTYGTVINNSIRFKYHTDNNKSLYIRNNDLTSLANFKTWLGTHNTSVYYVLNTPTTTLIEDEELVNQLESVKLISGLNNVSISSPNLPFIMDLVYNYVPAYTEEDILFCGIVKNTGNISLNPRHPHYCNLQVLDFKDFLSQGETLDFVINNKTIEEAIEQVISVIAPYGFIKGEVKLNAKNMVMGAYSTKDKTAYDVFNYLADITQSRWTTRMIDENTIAVDFYDTDKLPVGTPIDYNQTWFANHKIDDMSFSYSSNDYRNKQVMLSGEVYSNIETTEVITADGYQTQFNTIDKIGYVSSIAINGTPATIITKDEQELGYVGDFIYQPGNAYFESDDLISTGAVITIVYYAIIEGREIILNQSEIQRVANMTGRKGIVARYENRNDATTTDELQRIGKSYLKYKGIPEIKLNVSSRENTWNIGDRVMFNSPLNELSQEYMVKSKKIQHITTIDELFYEYELTSSFNMEQEVNFFDNQRYKTNGNIGEGEYISRNIDIENTANIIFYDLEVNEVQISGDSTLQSTLQTPLGVE